MARALVTGGSGFIGRYTVDRFLQDGYDVTVLDREPYDGAKDVDFLLGDIRDESVCERAVKDVDTVVHLAAMSRSGPSNALWEECVSSNVLGTANICRASANQKVRRFVYAGSATYYGDHPPPHKEQLPPRPGNAYAFTKWVGEETSIHCLENTNVGLAILRFFSVYGKGQPESGPYGLVMGIFRNCHKNGEIAQIFGSGEQTRDFVHVEDVARAIVLAAGMRGPNLTANIGSGVRTSINELAKLFDLRVQYLEERKGDAQDTQADIEEAREGLGWKPEIRLAEGIQGLME